MLSSPEIQQHAGSQKYNIGKNRSLNATFTFTSVQITKELFPKHIQRYNYIINLYHLQYLYQTKKAEFYPALPIIKI